MRVTLTLQTTIDTLFKPFWNAYDLKSYILSSVSLRMSVLKAFLLFSVSANLCDSVIVEYKISLYCDYLKNWSQFHFLLIIFI